MLGTNEGCYAVSGATVDQKLQDVRHLQNVRRTKDAWEMPIIVTRGHTMIRMLGACAVLGAQSFF